MDLDFVSDNRKEIAHVGTQSIESAIWGAQPDADERAAAINSVFIQEV